MIGTFSTTPSSSGHSAFSNMDTIDQINPTKVSSYKDSHYSNHSANTPSLFNDYGLDEPSSRYIVMSLIIWSFGYTLTCTCMYADCCILFTFYFVVVINETPFLTHCCNNSTYIM